MQLQLEQLPKHPNIVIDYASFKDNRVVSYLSSFNDAPVDQDSSETKEYHKGCWVTSYCGIGLNQLRYYPCGVAGSIDRIFELNLGFKHLKEVNESIAKLLDTFCKLCGNFTDYPKNKGNFIPRNEKPFRNLLFISMVLSLAESLDCAAVYTAFNKDDGINYWDFENLIFVAVVDALEATKSFVKYLRLF